ncbi:MAG: hypothetical protein SWN10_23690 [Pseudomonadota bacterium]|nr:hypothetical protein [Pseudomonadota bacterium]
MPNVIICAANTNGAGSSTVAQLFAHAIQPLGRPTRLVGCWPLSEELSDLTYDGYQFSKTDLRDENSADMLYQQIESSDPDSVFLLDVSAPLVGCLFERDAAVLKALCGIPGISFHSYFVVNARKSWAKQVLDIWDRHSDLIGLSLIYNKFWSDDLVVERRLARWKEDVDRANMLESGLVEFDLPHIPPNLMPQATRYSSGRVKYLRQRSLLNPIYKKLALGLV